MYNRLCLLFISASCLSLALTTCQGHRRAAYEEYQLAEKLWNDYQDDDALSHYLLAEELSKKAGDDVTTGRASIGIARILRNTCNYEEMVQFAGNAVNLLRDKGESQYLATAHWLLQSAYASLGDFQLSAKEAEMARFLSRQTSDTLSLARTLETSIRACILSGPNDYPALLSFADTLYQLRHCLSPSVLADLSIMYSNLGDIDKSARYLDSAYFQNHSPDQHLWVLYADYKLAIKINPAGASDVLKKMWIEQHDLYQYWMAHSGLKNLLVFQNMQRQAEMKERQTKQIWTFVLLLFLLLVFSFLAYSLEKHRKISALKAKALSDALDANVTALEELRLSAASQDELVVKLSFSTLDTLCENYYTGGHVKEQRVAQAFEGLIQKYRDDRSFWESFQDRVDQLHGGVLSLMKEELKGFKPKDFLLMTYIVSGMSYFSISVLMGVDKPNLYNRAKRIRDRIRSGNALHKELFLKALSRPSFN